MPLISKETWEKFTQEEKEKIQKDYKNNLEEINNDDTEADIEYKTYVSAAERYFGKENLQPKKLTYEDVARELFGTGIDEKGHFALVRCYGMIWDNKIKAIERLLVVAKFLNKDWKPDWENGIQYKWYIRIVSNEVIVDYTVSFINSFVYFRTEELAKQAIQILGEDVVRLALTTEY